MRPANTTRSAARLILLAFIALSAGAGPDTPPPPTPVAKATPVDDSVLFFAPAQGTAIPVLRLRVEPKNLQRLREEPRTYVPCTVTEDARDAIPGGAPGIKIKGAAGSSRTIDDQPALTLNTDKFGPDVEGRATPLFHGLKKLHLNNSVQDESLLNEWVCAEVFRAAGYPAPRVTHARVHLNNRNLGVYVVIEGFDKRFLRRCFTGKDQDEGNLYDGGFLADLDAELERDEGKGKVTRADLRALAAACAEDDAPSRWPQLEKLVDIELFLRFMALERIVGHWDGYTQHKNNYRLYFLPQPGGSSKAVFLPHGMDQTFTDPNFSVLNEPAPEGMLAIAVMRNPAWRDAYRKELSRLVAAFDPDALAAKIATVQSRLQPALKQPIGGGFRARRQAQTARELIDRIKARAVSLREQAARPEPKPLTLRAGESTVIDGWTETGETEDAHQRTTIAGAEWLRIQAPDNTPCIASWRRKVLLSPGVYRFTAEAAAQSITPLDENPAPGKGAGIRISGGQREHALTGTASRTLTYDFTVDAEREVVLVLELRALKGSVAFKAGSLTLTRQQSPDRQGGGPPARKPQG